MPIHSEMPPLGKCCRATLLEDGSIDQITFEVEVIVDCGLNGGESLEDFDIPETGHGTFRKDGHVSYAHRDRGQMTSGELSKLQNGFSV